ncbi:MAG: hypothetical protein ACREKL_01045 [Chthoniobacterales bacterium]
MEESFITILRTSAERGLPRLLIGGNAVILLGYIRTTADVDFLIPASSRSRWLDLLRELGWKFYNGTDSFAQFEASEAGGLPIDLMIVNTETWSKLLEGASEMTIAGEPVLLPKPEFLVALKLHAAASPTRSKQESDWNDIREIIRICGLDPNNPAFREIILRYGGDNALARIESWSR